MERRVEITRSAAGQFTFKRLQGENDWCVQTVEEANHPPKVVVNGVAGTQTLKTSAKAGERIDVSAIGSKDPDGDALEFKWFVYPEAGTYGKDVQILSAASASASLIVPNDASGKSIHVIVQVTDDGEPVLTRYRRVVVECGRRSPATRSHAGDR